MTKQYAQRDIESLDGYMTHVMAMTAEQLHSKSDIAGELAWRDSQISALQQELDAMAVECAQSKSLAEKMAERADEYKSENFGYSVFDSKNEFNQAIQTPATDAYLNSVRAEGAQMCIDALVKSDDDDFTDAPNLCAMVEYSLRSGTHDTAKDGD